MIRAASLKDNSNLLKYMPKMVEDTPFEETAEAFGIEKETYETIKMFDMCVRNIFKQQENAGDYLRLIIENFEGMLEGDDTKHLKSFYLIIPALSLSYVDHILKGKEIINSKNKNIGGFISDDGFCLGIAYLLKILKQTDKFARLNWFDSMLDKLEHDHVEITIRE